MRPGRITRLQPLWLNHDRHSSPWWNNALDDCQIELTSNKTAASCFRVFLDGDYTEPPAHLIPPTPMVEEINDCKCVIMWRHLCRTTVTSSVDRVIHRRSWQPWSSETGVLYCRIVDHVVHITLFSPSTVRQHIPLAYHSVLSLGVAIAMATVACFVHQK